MSDSNSEFAGNILIASVQVPFTEGGAEILVRTLKQQLEARNYRVDVVQLPFNAEPKTDIVKQMALWRALDLKRFSGYKIDLVIATKFPSYFVSHPCKVTWLVHQHRQVYDLYGSRFGDFQGDDESEALRQTIVSGDKNAFEECQRCYTISDNVSQRVSRYLGIKAAALPPPLPLGDRYRKGEPGNYILSVGRICSIKRVDMIIKAMSQIDESLTLKIVGLPDEPKHEEYLKNEIEKHHLWHRIEFLGRVDEEELIDLFAEAFVVYYAPFDEDYGFVTLEALASGVPVLTCEDSGGVLSYIESEVNGLVCEPREGELAKAVNRLVSEDGLRASLAANASSDSLTSTWDEVVESLTAPAFSAH